MDDYRGAFDPSLTLASWSRRGLGVLGREYMLFGHLLNRAALPQVHMKMGGEAREAVAIEEWMGASPIYSQRMQRAMRFEGDDVGLCCDDPCTDPGRSCFTDAEPGRCVTTPGN